MPKIPGVPHLQAVRALEKAGFRVVRDGRPMNEALGVAMDPDTGSFKFCHGTFEIGPRLTRSQFLESAVARHATIAVQNGPWCSWDLAERPDGGQQLSTRLHFHGETLTSVHLCDVSGKDRTWADWSREEERRREERHALWLREVLDGRTTFVWGTVWSGYDEKGGSAVVVIRYSGV